MRFVTVCLLVAACGGSKGQVESPEPPPGEAHATPPLAPDAGVAATPPATKPPEVPPPPSGTFTIVLKNDGDSDLSFGTTKGWSPVIFAVTGKPPKAKFVTLFEAACTIACDAPPEEKCPVCAAPETKKEESAMAKNETAEPGKEITVPWDGKVLMYEKGTSKHKCKCWHKKDAPPETYTFKACGRRPPLAPGKPSRLVCSETQVTLGSDPAPSPTITLSFGNK